jgi:hypothetical protein
MKLRVMCLQETGEEHLIGYARDADHAGRMVDEHMANHPEHHSAFFEEGNYWPCYSEWCDT